MRRVYGSFDLLAVHHARNILATSGIDTLVRNEYLSSAAGELPPAECQIELWVLQDADAARAEALLREEPAQRQSAWQCERCGEVCEPQFTQCWNCGASSPVQAA